MTGKVWQVVDAAVTGDAREAVEYGLMEAGALGTETIDGANQTVRVVAYFEGSIELDLVRKSLREALGIYGFVETALGEVSTRGLPEKDWLAEWKKHWQPVEVGRFVVAPSWSAAHPAPNRIILRIDPGMAFGTGTHETTRLCLKAIDKYFGGASFLDVGTGTGVLAIAAAKLAPAARVIACDTDGEAIRIAHENAAVNGVEDRIDFAVGTISEKMPSSDFVCANLTAPVIIELLPTLLGVTCGRLVLSGILDSQFEMVNRRLMQLTASVNEVMQDGEWIALVI